MTTGPFSKTAGIATSGPFFKQSIWYCQPKDRISPLPYFMDSTWIVNVIDPDGVTYGNSFCQYFWLEQSYISYNKAYGQLVGRIGNQSQWGVNLVERQQSVRMIEARSLQLIRFVKKLHRFDFPGAASELGLTSIPRGLKKKGKAFANNFLEFHFGWEPLVQDIGAAVDLHQKPYPKGKIFGSGRDSAVVQDDSFSSGTLNYHIYKKIDSSVRMGGYIEISNPNLYLANQLGFINPLSVAWELVPFSFVVDWFSNIGQVIGSMTDMCGVNLTKSYVTTFQHTQHIETTSGTRGSDPYYRYIEGRGVFMRRNLGISGPSIAVKPFKGFSFVRGTTAISLLLQQLRR